jgi:hypothetical protein
MPSWVNEIFWLPSNGGGVIEIYGDQKNLVAI